MASAAGSPPRAKDHWATPNGLTQWAHTNLRRKSFTSAIILPSYLFGAILPFPPLLHSSLRELPRQSVSPTTGPHIARNYAFNLPRCLGTAGSSSLFPLWRTDETIENTIDSGKWRSPTGHHHHFQCGVSWRFVRCSLFKESSQNTITQPAERKIPPPPPTTTCSYLEDELELSNVRSNQISDNNGTSCGHQPVAMDDNTYEGHIKIGHDTACQAYLSILSSAQRCVCLIICPSIWSSNQLAVLLTVSLSLILSFYPSVCLTS